MHRLAAALLCACFVLPTYAIAQEAQRGDVTTAAAALQAKVVDWRRDIHQHPELSNRETRTAAKVAEHLRSLGLEPRTGIAHHGVTAVLKGGRPGPRLALRADKDAAVVNYDRLSATDAQGGNSVLMLLRLLRQCGAARVLLAGADGYRPGTAAYADEGLHTHTGRGAAYNAQMAGAIRAAGLPVEFITPSEYERV